MWFNLRRHPLGPRSPCACGGRPPLRSVHRHWPLDRVLLYDVSAHEEVTDPARVEERQPRQKAAPGRVPVSLASRDATAPGAARARLRPAAGRPGDQRHRQLGRGHRDLGLRRVQVRRRPGRPRAALCGAVGTGCAARAAARRAHRPARPTSHADHRQPARHGRRDRADPGRQLHHDHPARVAARADRGHGRCVARCDPAPSHERRATAHGERARSAARRTSRSSSARSSPRS